MAMYALLAKPYSGEDYEPKPKEKRGETFEFKPSKRMTKEQQNHNGTQPLRQFIISGVSVMAVDKKMALKKYAKNHQP